MAGRTENSCRETVLPAIITLQEKPAGAILVGSGQCKKGVWESGVKRHCEGERRFCHGKRKGKRPDGDGPNRKADV